MTRVFRGGAAMPGSHVNRSRLADEEAVAAAWLGLPMKALQNSVSVRVFEQ